MRTVLKACPCVLRRSAGRWQVLVFEHPTAGWQIAKGTVDTGEDVADAALRELAEESGVTAARVVGRITGYVRPANAEGTEQHLWHLFHVTADPAVEAKETWTHAADGSEEERGLQFRFFWYDLHGDLERFHPAFHQAFAAIRQYVAQM